MEWGKLGLIITPEKVNRDWMVTHGMDPSVDHIKDDIFRVYYCGRNTDNQSLIGYADIDINDPHTILKTPENPVLGMGDLGCFDDNGVTASCIVNEDGKKYMYYIGWKPKSTTRFGLMTGLAESFDGGETFERVSKAPVITLTDKEPYSILTAPYVMKKDGLWRMWYVSCTGWVHADLPRYNLKYAESQNGIDWTQDGIVCLDYQSPKETAIARPSVQFENGIYRMWFCYKLGGERYRMGYAESPDGIKWDRMDEKAGLLASDAGWDSEMIEYPCVFNHKGKKYMLYNGNGYGVDGIGIAVLTSE